MNNRLSEVSYSGPYTIQSTGFEYSKTISSVKEVSITKTIDIYNPKTKTYIDSISKKTSDCYSQEGD